MNTISKRMCRDFLARTHADKLSDLAQRRLSGFNAFPVPAQRDDRTHELNISAAQVFLVMAIGLSSAGPLVWMFVRYWLFAV